jgi:hypothetical protein
MQVPLIFFNFKNCGVAMKSVTRFKLSATAALVIGLIFIIFNCTKEKIIIYKPFGERVNLKNPPNTDLTFAAFPQLEWEHVDDAVSYEVNVSVDANFLNIVVDEEVTDTSYQHSQQMDNDLYYWRVRAQNDDNVWGDWSEAMVWMFRINDNTDYMVLKSVVPTYGIAQDVFVVEEAPDSVVAYVADGQAGLTIVNVTDPDNPRMVGNLDHPNGDFAQSVWKLPGDDIAYMADMDGKIACLDTHLPLDVYSIRNVNLGFDQNLTDLTGIVFQDTIYMFTVNSLFTHRIVSFYQIVYRSGIPGFGDFYIVPPFDVPADAEGICFDSIPRVVEYYDADRESTYYETQECMFVFAGVTQAGLWWYDLSTTHSFEGADTMLIYSPRQLGWADTPYEALKLFAGDGYVYVADDRSGLQIFDLPDTIPAYDHEDIYEANPELISSVNTSGRTKDVHVVDNYCYMADGSGGLKIIDVADPNAPVFLAAYDTPYAYGVWAGQDYIYICDRDNGLMIFEKGELIQ